MPNFQIAEPHSEKKNKQTFPFDELASNLFQYANMLSHISRHLTLKRPML